MALALAFVIGALAAGPAWVLLGALIADTLTLRRSRRRRTAIDVHGTDALESWLAGVDWPRFAPTNGTPFEGDEVA